MSTVPSEFASPRMKSGQVEVIEAVPLPSLTVALKIFDRSTGLPAAASL